MYQLLLLGDWPNSSKERSSTETLSIQGSRLTIGEVEVT